MLLLNISTGMLLYVLILQLLTSCFCVHFAAEKMTTVGVHSVLISSVRLLILSPVVRILRSLARHRIG